MIEPRHEPDLKLTTFVCTGTPTSDEVEDQLSYFYGGTPTLHTIWDFTAADLSSLTAEKINLLAGYLKDRSHSRAGGRSALVYSLPQLQDLTDRLPSLAELSIAQATIKIFVGMDKARAWITD